MKQKAFTLIELLVVVLIIGILAAIAVPQYEKAVEKSKASQALVLLRSAYQAAAAHYMATGEKPNSFEEMGFEIPWTGEEKWSAHSNIKDTKSNGEWSLQLYHKGADGCVIYLGRINGKYQGAGFSITVVLSSQLTEGTIHCMERTNTGKVFSSDLNAGDYCEKIMNGTNTNSASTTYREYALP